ncbi:MAG: polysaccharide biosynthesis protein [Holosporaceae bacterium]|jgi:hypothetical protein|nr:polysaccharide biosynthesis protein [Holosporaceae bacterium]
MLNILLKKIIENIYLKKIGSVIQKYCEQLLMEIGKIPEEYMLHIKNIFILTSSYGLASFFIYPEFRFHVFIKEFFSLLCAYGAVYFWFVDRIESELPFKVAVGVTACVAPVWFINNQFGVAFFTLVLIIFFEFVVYEYMRGCSLFSGAIPVYIICENKQDAEHAKEFFCDYKILELIVLSDEKSTGYSQLKSVDNIKNWLKKIGYVPFYPSPRRFMYFTAKANMGNLWKLLELSANFSVPLFKATQNISNEYGESSLTVSPISIDDFEVANVSQSDKAALFSIFKGKRIWICYDGRGSILDLICLTSSVSSVDLTVLCESERLMIEAERELAGKCPGKNYKIKIVDMNLLRLQATKPDIFFYNMPVRSFSSGEENLKEAVAKNVLDTKKMIDFVQSSKISHVFIISSSRTLNANNWIGATQKLGELFAQFADSQNRKSHTKFKIIRIPEEATSSSGILGKIISSIFLNGYVNVDFPDSELKGIYHRKDVFPLFVKTIASLMKGNDSTSSVYTVTPQNEVVFEDFVKDVCGVLGLRKNKDTRVVYNCKSEEIKLDDFLNITESFEKTSIPCVLRTKFSCTSSENYDHIWTIEEIANMTTRELISAVFQSLREKI